LLLEGLRLSYAQVVSVKKVKYAHLGYMIILSRLHTLHPYLVLVFLRSDHSATLDPEQENNGSKISHMYFK
jgi:hypothetical protein